MPPLAEIQSLIRRGVLTGEISRLVSLLKGGRDPDRRFAIHQRHYQTSLVTALLEKFPATVWLAGTRWVTEAATRFVHECPPQMPCIAEYGRDFPKCLSEIADAERMPYLCEFAELEWHVGLVAIDVEAAPVSLEQLSAIPQNALPDTLLTLQPGVCYLQSSWPVDELMKLYLTDTAPDHFSMDAVDVHLELRGTRGEFHIDRIDAADFVFRKSISEHRSIGDAAEHALDVNEAFDPGQALAELFRAGLVIAISCGSVGEKL